MSIVNTVHVAEEAALAAGEVLSGCFKSGLTIRTKGASVDLVSDADINAERAIADVIRRHFPNHSILGEEEHAGALDADYLWIVDPLDGTTNFAHGIPHFAVSVACYVHGVAQCGVIYNPLRKDWFVAERGKGSKHNGNSLQVGGETCLDQVLIGTGFYYDRGVIMEATLAAVDRLFKQQIHGIRRFGTASLDFAAVAAGQFGAFFEYQLSPWDFAAGRLLVEEAGGIVTACDGSDLPLRKTSVLAAAPGLYGSVLETVRYESA